MSGAVLCLRCGRGLPPDFENADEFAPCPSCLEQVRVFAFPALRRIPTPVAAAPVLVPGEASCFYHPAKQAVLVCESCGRFVCALCDIELGDTHRCPSCVSSAKRKGDLEAVQSRRVLYDSMALMVAVVPVLFWPATLLTAPAALFLSLRHWRRPQGILPRTKVRFVFAILIALAQIGGWGLLFAWLLFGRASAVAK